MTTQRLVRAASLRDVDAVVTLRTEMFRAMGAPGVDDLGWQRAAARWVAAHVQDPNVRLTVVEVDGEIVSAAIAIRRSSPPSPTSPAGDDVLISNVCTRPDARGRGHARAALDDALGWSDRTGAGRVELLATEDGRQLYAAAGFRVSPHPVMRRAVRDGCRGTDATELTDGYDPAARPTIPTADEDP